MARHFRGSATIQFLILLLVLSCLAIPAWGYSDGTNKEQGNYTKHQLSYYLDQNQVAFVRPGLKFKIQKVIIGSDLNLGTQVDNEEYSWVPNGSPVTVVRDVVRTETCNKCHDPLQAHGGSRRDVALCVTCHTPQTVDPDTGNTVDLKVMVHKIHA